MDDSALQELVENHIIKDQIKSAFAALKHKIHDQDLHGSFLGQWRAFSQNEHAYHLGIIPYAQYAGFKKEIADEFIRLVQLILSDRSARSEQASKWMQAGQEAMENGDFNLADDYFQQVLSAINNHLQATFERAVVALNQGQFQTAVEGFTKVITVAPENHLALHNRGVAYLLLQQKSLACRDWQRVQSLGFTISDAALKEHSNPEIQ
ncbi:MAG: hypothetical protein AB8G22_04340 [Saprospiraceae bacterium]